MRSGLPRTYESFASGIGETRRCRTARTFHTERSGAMAEKR
jgi:hypothetical protein